MWNSSDSFNGGFWGVDDVSDFWTNSDIPLDSIQGQFILLNPLSTSAQFISLSSLPVSCHLSILTDLSLGSQFILLNSAAIGGSYAVLGGFGVDSQFILLSPLSVSAQSILLNPLAIGSQLIVLTDIGWNLTNLSYVIYLSSMAEGAQQIALNPLPLQTRASILTDIAEGVQSNLITLTDIASGPVQGQLIMLTDMAPDNEPIQGRLIMLTDIGNPLPTIRSVDFGDGSTPSDPNIDYEAISFEILLDGVSIAGKINSFNMSISEDSIHNSCQFSALMGDFYDVCDPATNSGQHRVTVTIAGRSRKFMLIDRKSSEPDFSVTCISLSGNLDEPYNVGAYSLSAPKLASEIASELMAGRVTWDVIDDVVPESFFCQTPMEGLQRLSEITHSIVRTDDNGDLVIRARRPVLPVDQQGTAADVDFDRDNIFVLGSEVDEGSGINAVEVRGLFGDATAPDVEVESVGGDRLIGSDAYVRAYFRGQSVVSRITAIRNNIFGIASSGSSGSSREPVGSYVTDGNIRYLNAHTEVISEIVAFSNGVANTSKPVHSISAAAWIGDSGGAITSQLYETMLTAGVEWGIAEITYTTQYHKWLVSNTNVEKVLGVLSLPAGRGVAVRVRIYDSDTIVAGEGISDELITSEAVAVVRGTAIIDSERYDKSVVSIEVPYYPALEDGALIRISDADARVDGIYYVRSVDVNFDGVGIFARIEAEQCLIN